MSRNPVLVLTAGCRDACAGLLLAGIDWLAGCRERARQRRTLAAMDDWQLKDIGLSRADIDQESRKAFWRP